MICIRPEWLDIQVVNCTLTTVAKPYKVQQSLEIIDLSLSLTLFHTNISTMASTTALSGGTTGAMAHDLTDDPGKKQDNEGRTDAKVGQVMSN
jgi:hypothetical protein